jgi:hypothetical protein
MLWQDTKPKAAKQPESDVKATIRTALSPQFDLREEVTGTGPEGQKVRIDFVARPNARLVSLGWPETWTGIEAKGHELQDQRKKTAARLLSQAILYGLSTYTLDGETQQLDIVLVYPTFARIVFDSTQAGVYGETFQDGYALALAKVAAMFRICELVILPDGVSFEVYAHGINRWFSSRWGKSSVDCLGKRDNHASR